MYVGIGLVVVALLLILFFGGKSGTTNQPVTVATTSVAATKGTPLISVTKTASGASQSYSNKLLGFSFDNPRPGVWVADTSGKDGSLVSFGPKVPEVGVGLKVYYWSGTSEFPSVQKISTITDLRNAVLVKYPQAIPESVSIISAGGFSMVEIKGLNAGFSTVNSYFVLLPTGTLNFGGEGNLSGLIHKI